ncbi:SctK family type III secretion system sorting platform protein [Variovorax sp. JS1663]|uniref:SctK family type III secretion system sorting platform protein n=1 Tax=Variovorax sp. JS1663 TaxID=1851577 RepID=UPI000B348CA7|nr:SctK family type III secretion system sorting platform protein [Variovorax sp. JS1663]OUM01959.1 type III secretion system protein [Variovorax sp. JS1663]
MSNEAPATTPQTAPGPMDLVRLVTRFNLHPEHDLHPSWLPANWPARHRLPRQLGEGGRAVLAELLRREVAPLRSTDYNFDSRLKRLALLDAAALRRLAAYLGFCAHLPLLRVRGGVGAQLRRQARRFDADAVDFLLERAPQLTGLRMNHAALEERPLAAGRIVVDRGHRLLLGAAAAEGETVLRRLQHKLPRRVAALGLPRFEPHQARQLHELMLACIVPERLPQWDWLF